VTTAENVLGINEIMVDSGTGWQISGPVFLSLFLLILLAALIIAIFKLRNFL